VNGRDRAVAAFRAVFGASPSFLVRSPGRVNLLGEHVDYNDGLVLPAATDRAVWLAVAGAAGSESRIVSVDFGDEARFGASADTDVGWARYPAAVVKTLTAVGRNAPAMVAAMASDVPIGSGLSSSAAVEVAWVLACKALGGWAIEPAEIAELCRRAENESIGVASGIMDPFAITHARAGHLLFLDCRSLEWEPVPFPSGVAIVIADSGIRRALGDTGYNRRRIECREALRELRRWLPGLESLRDVSAADLDRFESRLSPVSRRRTRHVVEEIARVEAAVTGLRMGGVRALGEAIDGSHRSLRDLYEVSRPELDALVAMARAIPGCHGARLTGAGFGGCTVNIVAAGAEREFCDGLARDYEARIGIRSRVWASPAADGASVE
jgi:galactokinase